LPQPRMGSTTSFASASAPTTPASAMPSLPPWAQQHSTGGTDQQHANSNFLQSKGSAGMVGGMSAALAATSGGQPVRAGSQGAAAGLEASSSMRNGVGGSGYTPAIYLVGTTT
jgi:hypothetical protein